MVPQMTYLYLCIFVSKILSQEKMIAPLKPNHIVIVTWSDCDYSISPQLILDEEFCPIIKNVFGLKTKSNPTI